MALQIIILILLVNLGIYGLFVLSDLPKLLQALIDRKHRQGINASRKFYQIQSLK